MYLYLPQGGSISVMSQANSCHAVLFKSWEALEVVKGQIQETLQNPQISKTKTRYLYHLQMQKAKLPSTWGKLQPCAAYQPRRSPTHQTLRFI